MRKILFGSLVSLLLLAMVGCSGDRFGDNSNGKTNFGLGGSDINGFPNLAGNSDASKPLRTPAQTADVTVSSPSPAMDVGGTMQFAATTKDSSKGAPSWTSSEPGVATIDNRGVATGTGAGMTKITATEGGKTSSPVVLTLCDYRHTE
jgi:hypothetical protein